MSEEDFLSSITVRISYEMLSDLKTRFGKGRRYRDRSDAIRSLINLGLKVDSMLQVMNDPKKKEEFEKKFAFLLKEKNTEKQLETMNEEELNHLSYLITRIKEKKVQLLLDEIR